MIIQFFPSNLLGVLCFFTMWHILLLPNSEVVSIFYNVNIAFFFLHLPGISSYTFILYLSIIFYLSSISYKQNKVKFWFRANLTVCMFKRKFYYFHIMCHFWHLWTNTAILFRIFSFITLPLYLLLIWIGYILFLFFPLLLYIFVLLFLIATLKFLKHLKHVFQLVCRANQYWQSPVE